MKRISQAIAETRLGIRQKNLSQEFQIYGIYLAEYLGDKKHYSLYIKLAKELPRSMLEEALAFCKEYYQAKNKARVFMWKLHQLRDNKTI